MKCRNDVLHLFDCVGSVRKNVAIGLDVFLCFYRPGADAVVNPMAWDIQLLCQLRDRQKPIHASRMRLMSGAQNAETQTRQADGAFEDFVRSR